MAKNNPFDTAGIIPAVKCAYCDTLYPADSSDFLAFYGSLAVGLDKVIVGVDPPKKPAKHAIVAVCREPTCVGRLTRQMLGCDGEKGDAGHLWAQVLKIWAEDAGHTLEDAPEVRPTPPQKKLRRA